MAAAYDLFHPLRFDGREDTRDRVNGCFHWGVLTRKQTRKRNPNRVSSRAAFTARSGKSGGNVRRSRLEAGGVPTGGVSQLRESFAQLR